MFVYLPYNYYLIMFIKTIEPLPVLTLTRNVFLLSNSKHLPEENLLGKFILQLIVNH